MRNVWRNVPGEKIPIFSTFFHSPRFPSLVLYRIATNAFDARLGLTNDAYQNLYLVKANGHGSWSRITVV